MDILKGLLSGLFHEHICGAEQRKQRFKELKSYVDQGLLIRDIQPAPRDSRYKIDFYYAPHTNIESSFNATYLWNIESVLRYIGMDENFNPKTLDTTPATFGDFTLSKEMVYGVLPPYKGREINVFQYTLRYKGEIDTLKFNAAIPGKLLKGEYVYPGRPTIINDFESLMYQIKHYVTYYNSDKVERRKLTIWD